MKAFETVIKQILNLTFCGLLLRRGNGGEC